MNEMRSDREQNKRCLAVTVTDPGQRTVMDVLRREMRLTKTQISRAKFREDGICRNGFRVRVSETVKPGDQITFLLEDPKAGAEDGEICRKTGKTAVLSELPVIYEDEDILITDKPAGLAVHPSHGHHGDTVRDILEMKEKDKGKSVSLHVVGRLDKETSGLLLLAKHSVAAARLSRPGHVRKEYEALVQGTIAEETFTIRFPVRKKPGCLNRMEAQVPEGEAEKTEETQGTQTGDLHKLQGDVQTADRDGKEGWKAACTHCTVLPCYPGFTHILCRPETGRTHQIRVHLAAAGHPLLGDLIYHDRTEPVHVSIAAAYPAKEPKRAALHCSRMQIIHPVTGTVLSFAAPLPEDMAWLIKKTVPAAQLLPGFPE